MTTTSLNPALQPAQLLLWPDNPAWKASGRLWQGIPGIERTPEGRLYALWYSGGKTEEPGNIVILEMSQDDGATWTDGFCVIHHPDERVRCFDPCIWLDPMGRLWVFWTQSEGFFDGRGGVWCAICDGPDHTDITFTAPRRIFDGVMLNKPVACMNGEWLFPAALWKPGILPLTHPHPELSNQRLSNVFVTLDGGETFQRRGGADIPRRSFDEHMLLPLKDGRLWLAARTDYGIGQAFSADGGRFFTDAGPSGHTGPCSRFFLRRLSSGRILLINHVNPSFGTGRKPYTVRNNLCAMLSEDEGETWRGLLALDTRNQVSYPDATQAANGDIYVTYDYQRYEARHILMAVFNEADILAGTLVSANGRLRQLISAATGTREGE